MSRRKLRTRADGERVTFRTFAEPGLFLLPFFIGLLVFTVYPFINVILLSFRQDYSLMTGEFSGIGLGNYAEIFHDANFLNGLRNTALYVLFVVPIVTVLSLFLASLLNSCTKLQGLFQTCYFLPMVTSVTAVGLVWKWMFNYDYGLINYALSLFGVSPVNWLKTRTIISLPSSSTASGACCRSRSFCCCPASRTSTRSITRPRASTVRPPGAFSAASPCRCSPRRWA